MNTRITTGVLATLLGGITLLLPGLGQAGTIGYMDMCGNDQAAHAAAISAAGHTPVYVPVPDSEALATLDGLSVTNCDNGGFGTAYTDHLAAITAAVNGGMVLFVHDRTVTDAGSILLDTMTGVQTLIVNGIATASPGTNAAFSGVVTFSPDMGGAIPEPGMWALMILGFGFIGGALRSRRNSSVKTNFNFA